MEQIKQMVGVPMTGLDGAIIGVEGRHNTKPLCEVEAFYTPRSPDTLFWKKVTGYPLSFSLDVGGFPEEKGVVRFAWNEQGIFVRAELEDSFLIANARCDEQLHFETGDVFELFVKPLNDDYYWEMYVTPFGNKSTLFFPHDRAGMDIANFLHDHDFHSLAVSSEITPAGWVAELFVPAAQLTAFGGGWSRNAEWTVLCGRYNYNNEALAEPELSMLPSVSRTNYHLTNEYARMAMQSAN